MSYERRGRAPARKVVEQSSSGAALAVPSPPGPELPRAPVARGPRWSARGCRGLEGDVVLAAGGAAAGGGRGRGLQVALVDRDVAAAREAIAVAGTLLAAAEELHRLGDDVDALALVALLVLPLAPLQAPVDGHGAALAQVARAVLALGAPDGDVEVVGLVLPFTRAVVLA